MTISSLFPLFKRMAAGDCWWVAGDKKSHDSMRFEPHIWSLKIWVGIVLVLATAGGKAVKDRTLDEWPVLNRRIPPLMIRAFRLSIENEFHMSYSLYMY